MLTETLERLMAALSETDQEILSLRLQGDTLEELAESASHQTHRHPHDGPRARETAAANGGGVGVVSGYW